MAATGPDATPAPLPPADAERVNVLIVDDEPKNLLVLETVLDDPGYRLVRATSGEQALLALVAHEFAVLVLDVRMPGMTGFELAGMIKERRKTARVPIIFLTAYYNEDEHILEGYGSGAVDYLRKPVNAAVLRSKVAVFAELHRRGRALEQANRALLAEVAERRLAESRLSELNDTLESRVTERTEALRASEAQLRDADRNKDEFLATLAHELRNPLAPVRTAIEVLRRNGPSPAQLGWASQLIDRQVQAMSRLVDDLMDVGRINQGKIDLRLERSRIEAVLDDAIESTRPLIDEFGHALTVTQPEGALWVDADPTRLAQAFMNLLNNAAKYTDPGGRIDVVVSADDIEVHVVVRDNGIGIAADRLTVVFNMFSQVEAALSRSRGGLGIGLSLTRRLIELHGGRTSARSEGLGQGSCFGVSLPRATAPVVAAPAALAAPLAAQPVTAPAAVVSAESASPGGVSGISGTLRVLVADDNADAADALVMLLEMNGYEVRHVGDGEAAVVLAAEFRPDVALLDIGMPKLNGYEACRRMRAQPGGDVIKMVAVTGWGQPSDRRASQEAGFDLHFVKPLDPKALGRLLDGLRAGGGAAAPAA